MPPLSGRVFQFYSRLLSLLRRGNRIFCYLSYLRDHFFERRQDEVLTHFLEEERAHRQDDADAQRRNNAKNGRCASLVAQIVHSDRNSVVIYSCVRGDLLLGAAKLSQVRAIAPEEVADHDLQ